MKRHLISAADLTRDDAVLILDTAEEMARVADRPIKKDRKSTRQNSSH